MHDRINIYLLELIGAFHPGGITSSNRRNLGAHDIQYINNAINNAILASDR
jgi:hypothetical protein